MKAWIGALAATVKLKILLKMVLTLYHTILTFNDPEKETF